MNLKKNFSVPILYIYLSILVLLPLITFANSLNNEFILDDYYFIVGNPGIQKVMPIWRHFFNPRTMSTIYHNTQFRPILPLSFSINYAISKDSRVGYRLTNLLFHIIAVLLGFFFLLELQKEVLPVSSNGITQNESNQKEIAFFAAVLFSIHPVSGIPINYLSNRDILLMLIFLLSSLIMYMRMRRTGETKKKWACVLVLFALSILSKTNSIVMPLIIFTYEVIFKGQKPDKFSAYVRSIPFAAIIVFIFLYTKYVLHFSDITNLTPMSLDAFLKYPFTQAKLHLFTYLPNFILPYFLIYMMPHADQVGFNNPLAILGISFIVFTLYLAFRLKKQYPIIAFCICMYWILFIADSSFIPLYQPRKDYRAYQSGIFLFTILGLVSFKYLKPNLRNGIFIGLLLCFGVSSFLMNRTYKTLKGLWLHSIQHGPTPISELNYAMTCDDLNERKQHLEAAIKLEQNNIWAHMNLGVTLINMGNTQEGLGHLKWAAQGDFSYAYFWLAKAYDNLGMRLEAAKEAKTAAVLDPQNLEYSFYAAQAAQNTGDFAGSLEIIGNIEKKEPDYLKTQFLKAFALQMMGKPNDAAVFYGKYLAKHPDDAQAWFNSACLFMESKKFDKAVPYFKRVLEINPKFTFAYAHLSTCYKALKDDKKSEEYKTMFDSLDPGKQAEVFNKAFALQKEGKYKEAAGYYKTYIANNPSNTQAMYNLALDLMSLKSYNEAALYFEKVLAISPATLDAHLYLAECYAKLGKTALAQQHKALYSGNLFNNALNLQKAGKVSEAISLYRIYLKQNPNDLQANFTMAYGLMDLKMYQESITYFNRTLVLKPDYHEVHYYLSVCYKGLGDNKTSDRELAFFKKLTHQ